MEYIKKLGFKIKVISNEFRRYADLMTSSLDLTASQSFILGYIARRRDDPPCQHDIELEFHIKHPTATGILARLAEKGFVVFESDRNDARRKIIVITEKGISVADKIREHMNLTDKKLTSPLTEDETAELHRLLDKIINEIDTGKENTLKGDDAS